MHADSNVRLQNQSYTQSYQEHLFPVFEGQSRTREMDCTRHTRCKFGIVRKDYTGVIIGILFVVFILVMGFIGGTSRSSETTWVVSGGAAVSLPVSQKKKNEIDGRPIYWDRAILTIIIATLLIKYIRSDIPAKIIDFTSHSILLEDRDWDIIKSYPFSDILYIEVLRYHTETYEHYELNLQLITERINLYVDKNDRNIIEYANKLSKSLHKPVIKIVTNI
jgi:hypothetical protein